MGSKPQSTTTGPGTARARLALPAVLVALLAIGGASAGCGHGSHVARLGDTLVPGTMYEVDLDGDGRLESVYVDADAERVVLHDGDITYRSRAKWRVVTACLGDADRNGLPEVVTLLDADDGRHLGLFAFFGGEYRERLVTSELLPVPLSLRILPGNLVELTQESGVGEEPMVTIYRWNGFGFTAVDTSAGQ